MLSGNSFTKSPHHIKPQKTKGPLWKRGTLSTTAQKTPAGVGPYRPGFQQHMWAELVPLLDTSFFVDTSQIDNRMMADLIPTSTNHYLL